MNAIQSAAQEQLNKLKAECVRRLEEQKKELQAKQNEMGDLGFSAMPMMDPFAGLGTGSTPPVTPSADAETAESALEDFGDLAELKTVAVPEVVVPEVAAPVVDTSAMDELRAVGATGEGDG